MEQNKFIELLPNLQQQLGQMEQVIVGSIGGPYSKGCFYDEVDKKWKVYECDEKRCRIRMETSSESEAFDKLYSMVIFRIETLDRLRKRDLL